MTIDSKSKTTKKKITIEISKSEFFRQIYVVGAMGGHSPYDFRIGFYNDTPKIAADSPDVHTIQRKLESEIILSPLAALELATWLNQHLKDYEATFGPITRVQKTPYDKDKPAKDSSEMQGYI